MPSTIINKLPYIIKSSGQYVIGSDMEFADEGIAIHIAADDVQLDFGGHIISGAYSRQYDSTAILITSNNVEIKNGSISGFMSGVLAEIADGITATNSISVHDMSFGYNYYRAIRITLGNGNNISNNRIHHTGGTEVYPDAYGIGVEIVSGRTNKISNNQITETYGVGVGEGVGISFTNNCSDCEISGNHIANSGINEYSGTFGIWTSSPPDTAISINDNSVENMLYGICRKARAHDIRVFDNVLKKVHCISDYDNLRDQNIIIDEQKCFDEIPGYFKSGAESGNVMAMHKHAIHTASKGDINGKYEWLYKAAYNGSYESRRVLKRDSGTYNIKEAIIWQERLEKQEFNERLPFMAANILAVAIIAFMLIKVIRKRKV